MKRPVAPCKDCKNRNETCHGKCEKYQAFEKEHQEWKDKFRDGRDEYMLYRHKQRKKQR